VKSYIEMLSESHIISVIRPYYTNKNKEIIKIPKIYFNDNGARNFLIDNFNRLNLRNDAGFLFEGYIFSEFIKKGFQLKFWQDKNKREVDMVIDKIHKQIPVEIKFKRILKSDDFTGIKAFLREYQGKGYLVNIGEQEKKEDIKTILPYDLSLFLRL
jgi:hypothetical protein